MFDIGFSELVVIGLVALIVIGPEDLPRVARTAGHLMGKLRRYVADVKADIGREMELADLKRMQEEVKEAASEIQNSINNHARALQEELQQAAAPLSELTHTAVDSSSEVAAEAEAGRVGLDHPGDAGVREIHTAPAVVETPVQVAEHMAAQTPVPPGSEPSHRDATDVRHEQASNAHPTASMMQEGSSSDVAAVAGTPPDDNQLDLFGMPVQKHPVPEEKA